MQFTTKELQAIKELLSHTLQPGRLDIAGAVVELTSKIDVMLNAPPESADLPKEQ